MKLVVTWTSGDDCTYWCSNVDCIEYESEEQFIVDLEAWSIENKGKNFFLCGEGFLGSEITPDVFFDSDYAVYTLDAWFKENAHIQEEK